MSSSPVRGRSVTSDIEAAYRQEARSALAQGKAFPLPKAPTLHRIKQKINKHVQEPITIQDKAD